VSRGSVIQVVFVDLELESHPRCMHDYIQVSTLSTHTLTASALNYCHPSIAPYSCILIYLQGLLHYAFLRLHSLIIMRRYRKISCFSLL